MDNEEMQSSAASVDACTEGLRDRVFKPGENFGDFRVVQCLSSSLLANYYHMQHVRDLNDLTVCVFHSRTTEDSKCLKRLQRLKSTLRLIDHEGVPKIQDCLLLNNRHCLFMDLVQGQSVSQYFVEHATPGASGLGVAEVTRLMALLLGLLGYAHTHGIDHRDLDTDLIIIQNDGSIKVLGLGVKATLGDEVFESIVSASISPFVANEAPARLNSFDVMSPEYRRGISEDYRVDIFTSGHITYWLLTGVKADLSAYKPPSTMIEGLPESWDTFAEMTLQRNRDDRYQSCKSSLIALKNTDKEPASEQAGLIQRQIDRIPVPKGIVGRGEQATRIYRLAVIGLIGVTLTALAASFITDEETEVEAMISVATEVSEANFQLSLVPAVAQVRFTDVDEVFEAKGGALDLVVQPGSYEVRITAPNYLQQQLSISIIEGAKPKVTAVELQPALKDLEIQTLPGATIVLFDPAGTEVELGLADAEGVFRSKQDAFVEGGRIMVRKQGYSSVTLDGLSSGQQQAVLVALSSSLTVRTQPHGARVWVNHLEVGRSPVTIDAENQSGDYLVVVDHEDYRSVNRRVDLNAGEHEVVDFGALVPCHAALDFIVNFAHAPERDFTASMTDFEVEIDGQLVPYGSEMLNVVPVGMHALRLLHPLYVSELQAVTVEDQVDQTLTYLMTPLPGRVKLALPQGLSAEVRLNRATVDLTDGAVLVAAYEPVLMELRIKDYHTMTRLFEVDPDETVVWDVVPVAVPAPELGHDWAMPYLAMQLAWIEAGQFSMGSPIQESGRLPNEGPQAAVRFSQGFWAGVHEVTQAQYFQIMNENPSSSLNARSPVDHVSWEDAQLYCQKLTSQEQAAGRLPEGYVYRLPTEAEWEYAARGGSVAPFAFGARADSSMGNFRGSYPAGAESRLRGPEHYGSLPVGSYPPNPFGLHDVHGNLAEWSLDRYNGRLAGASQVDPRPREAGPRVAVRGGSWEDFAVRVRSSARDQIHPDTRSDAIGFRVVLAPAF